MPQHTFLLQAGQWKAEGTFYDHRGVAIPIQGTALVTHEEERWLNQSQMQLLTHPPLDFATLYDIEPMDANMESTIWETQHASLGLMMGTLVVIEDCIIMSYAAEGGNYSGTETLRKIDDQTYQSWGVLWQGDQKVSSWTAKLNQVHPELIEG